jgi:hypothetical protein
MLNNEIICKTDSCCMGCRVAKVQAAKARFAAEPVWSVKCKEVLSWKNQVSQHDAKNFGSNIGPMKTSGQARRRRAGFRRLGPFR